MLPATVRRLAFLLSIVVAGSVCAQAGEKAPAPAKSPAASSAPKTAPAAKAAPAKEKSEPVDPTVMEKEFTITLTNGTKIKCQIFPNAERPGKIVKFDPAIPASDAALHNASLNSMWQVFGPKRGSFRPEDASIVERPDLNTRIVVYKIKTGAKFCVYPTRDDATKTYKAIKVWME